MNPEVFCVGPEELAADVGSYLKALGVRAAPVVDEVGFAVGMISLRDLYGAEAGTSVGDHMSAPPDTIDGDTTIDAAANVMAQRDRHHLIVTDEVGRVVGFLGSLDVIRGLRGLPVKHPAAFPNYDRSLAVTWTDTLPLVEANIPFAPDGAGLLRVIRSVPAEPDAVVWSQATHNVRSRLVDIVRGGLPHLGRLLASGSLRFRAAALD